MKSRQLARRMRRALGTLAFSGAVAATSAVAVAGPTVDVPASWNQPAVASAGGFWTSTDNGLTIQGKANADYPALAHLISGFCNPFGPNTRLVGATLTRVRWHANANDMTAYMRLVTPAGADLGVAGGLTSLQSTRRYLYNYAPEGVNLQLGAANATTDSYTFTGGDCIQGGILFNGPGTDGVVDTPGWTPLVTNRLDRVTVEDLQGPSVANATSWTSWITGDSAPIEWDQSDNGFNRGTTGASVAGGATLDLGDPGNGRTGAWVGVGALADGQQHICAYRTAPVGFASASICAAFKLDRTDPAAPGIGLTPDTGGDWTNQDVTVATSATADGSGSGWDRNQFSIDGGPFADMAASFTRTQEGEATLVARAVDKAGRVSSPSAPRIVRIDKTSPDPGTPGAWTATPTGNPRTRTITLPGLSDAGSGLASVAVLVNSDPSGGQADAAFSLAGSVDAPQVPVSVTADLSGQNGGVHATRIVATDRAGNVLVAPGPAVALDGTGPTVGPISVAPNGVVTFTMSDAGGFGACPVTIDLNGPGTGGAWQTVFSQAAGTLPATFGYQLPMAGLPAGEYQVRTSVCDATGNTTTRISPFSWTDAAAIAGGPAGVGAFHATGLRSDVQIATRLVNGHVLPVIRGTYNRVFTLRGHLQRPDGTALADVGIELRDSASRYVTGTRTDASGNFSLRARATIGGVWTLNEVGRTDRAPAALLEVRPIVQARTVMGRGTGSARRLVVTGRVIPQAGVFNKAIQLQWRDPRTRTWRPAVNARVARNGRFRIVYQFRRPGGYRVAFRVAMPHDRGWPYLASASRPVNVTVR